MHVRVRMYGRPDTVVVVESKLTKIDQFRKIIRDKFDVQPKLQKLLYGGKFLENGYTFHDYNIKLNDVIQLTVQLKPDDDSGNEEKVDRKKDIEKDNYVDAVSSLCTVGDLIDVRDMKRGCWFEGKIVRIVYDPDSPHIKKRVNDKNTEPEEPKQIPENKSDSENNPPANASTPENKPKKKGTRYINKKSKPVKKNPVEKEVIIKNTIKVRDDELLYSVQLDLYDNDIVRYCELKHIRPRAREVIAINELTLDQKVMINYNCEHALETGHWYDFQVKDIVKHRNKNYKLIGTLFLGPDAWAQHDTTVKVHDKIYAIEEFVPLEKRSAEYKKMMITQPQKRSQPLNCSNCRDNEDRNCRECGCYICSKKEFPENILLCDECNYGYHIGCLSPPLDAIPEDDWYCPECKRDLTEVVAPGAAEQAKKPSTSGTRRDWGRGMACVGKTKSCPMPSNHFGPIPGIEVGMSWKYRIQLSETGVHRPPVSGIHGRAVEGAYSLVLSGGYEDDVDNGYEFTYTGSGGRDLSGNKRTAEQSRDQNLVRENKALARNCAVEYISLEGADAGDNWQSGKPVRVVRSEKMLKHFPMYAPKQGIRYDGIYKVVKYYPETGLSGFRVWKYLLRRDDPNPAPWEPNSIQYPITYPDGYLQAQTGTKDKNNALKTEKAAEKSALKEAETPPTKNIKTNKAAEKSALKEAETPPTKNIKTNKAAEKRALKESKNPPTKKMKTAKNETKNEPFKDEQRPGCSKDTTYIVTANSETIENNKLEVRYRLTDKEHDVIKEDRLNVKLWVECILVYETKGRTEFLERVTQVFLCIICHDIAAAPVTTPCLHNFCWNCLKLAYRITAMNDCPCCRQKLNKFADVNKELTAALRYLFPRYDCGKKLPRIKFL